MTIMYKVFLIHGTIRMCENSITENKKRERYVYLCEYDTLVGGNIVCPVPEAGQYNLYKSGPYRMFDPELRVQ